MTSMADQAIKYIESLNEEELDKFLEEIVEEFVSKSTAKPAEAMRILGGAEDLAYELGLLTVERNIAFADESAISINNPTDSDLSFPSETSGSFHFKKDVAHKHRSSFSKDDLSAA